MISSNLFAIADRRQFECYKYNNSALSRISSISKAPLNPSEYMATILSCVYLVFIVVLSLTLFAITAIHHYKEYSEIYTLVLITVSIICLVFFSIDIYLHRKRAKDLNHNTVNFDRKRSRYVFLNGRHADLFYLKFGSTWFGMGLIIHCSLLLIYEIVFIKSKDCGSYISLFFEVIFPIYSLFLLFFLYKFSSIIIEGNIIIARFFIMHCIGTSMTIWIFKVMFETKEAILGSFYYKSVSANCSGPETLNSIYNHYSPYLYPFVIEFYILNAGILFMIWYRIGTNCNNISLKPSSEIHADFSRSCRGLLAGLGLIGVTICFIILSFVVTTEREYFGYGLTLESIFELVVLVVISLTVIVASKQTSKLSIRTEPISKLDDVLLFIGIPGILAQAILLIIPAIILGSLLDIFNASIQILQVFIQTPFIITRLRYCSDREDQVKTKPGREMVSFLVVANISLWFYYTFTIKSGDAFEDRKSYYGYTLWSILHHITLPFVMFYRFHSSVCLAHIWKHSYEKAP